MNGRRTAPVSRRQRPAKPPLSREWIIAETIRIMRDEGLPAVTMRRVARALDTGPASLYVYVANTTALHAAVIDDLMGQLTVRTHGDWASRLRCLLVDYRDLLFGYPGLARSAMALRPSGPNTVAFLDSALGLLLAGGSPPARAAWTVDLLMLYTTALAAEHVPSEPADTPDARWHSLVDSILDAEATVAPNVADHAQLLLGGTPAQRWSWALDVLIGGGSTTPTPLEDQPTGAAGTRKDRA